MSEARASNLDDLLDIPINFAQLADPIPPQYRPERRVALCLLLVDKSWGGRASWKALHVLNWAVQSAARVELLLSLRGPDDILDRPIVRFEPALDRALDLAVGLDLLGRRGLTYELTEAGRDALKQVRDSGAFEVETTALNSIKGKISGKELDLLLEWRTT